jgi:AraC-like DNA-binding protein/TolA-binding protein
MNIEKLILLIIGYVLLATNPLIAQENKTFVVPDSLKSISYEGIYSRIEKNVNNLDEMIYYARVYLCKAESENNIKEIIRGYGMLATFSDFEIGIQYADKMIALSKTKCPDLLAFSYYRKGNILYGKKKLKESLENLLAGLKTVDKNDLFMAYAIKYLLGVVRNSQGYYQEALTIFLECETYHKQNSEGDYLVDLCAISEVYNRLNKIEKSSYYTNLGLQLAQKKPNLFNSFYFIACRGKDAFKKKQFDKAIIDLKSTLSFFKKEDFANFAENSFYIGKSYLGLHKKEQALVYFKKVDSVFVKENSIYPDVIPSYNYIISYYKNKGDLKNQLYYTEQLIKADSVVASNYAYLTAKIHKEYDIPQLMSEKEAVINQLTNKDSLSTFKIIGLSSFALLLLSLVFYLFRKQKKDKQIFDKLVLAQELKTATPKVEQKVERVVIAVATTNSVAIKEDKKEEILEKFKEFEVNLRFLDKNCTLDALSKQFNTNTAYLSKVVNEEKGVNFSTYINGLRIDYAIKKMQEDQLHLSHTIEGIAKEVGFNTAESFSKAFFAKTGIKPSYFIRELKNKELQD